MTDGARLDKFHILEKERQGTSMRERIAEARKAAIAETQHRTSLGPRGLLNTELNHLGAGIVLWAQDVIAIHRELGAIEPTLLTAEELAVWFEQAKRLLSVWGAARTDHLMQQLKAAGEPVSIAPGQMEPSVLGFLNRAQDRLASGFKEMLLEAELGIPSKAGSTGNISVTVGSNSNAAITIHSTVGRIGSLVNTFGSGNDELARIVAELARAIETSRDLQNDDKIEALATIQDIAEDIPQPKGKIRATLLLGLYSLLSRGADIAQIVGVTGPMIAAHYGFHWPGAGR